jgi:DNA sulfur modification protein DndB
MGANTPKLVLPAVRGRLGDWAYYCATMKLKHVAERITFAHVIHPSKTLNELIQRALKERSHDIRDYILNQRERFFSSLVVGVYGGDPQWLDIKIGDNPFLAVADIPRDVQASMGVLVLSGDEQLFALDGQHRLSGIMEAVERTPAIGEEQISALFVAHKMSANGLERTRRLFTTLNRYAKPVSERDGIALDEDDVAAIVTRRLVEEHPLFVGDKTSTGDARNLQASNKTAFTTIVALYHCVEKYLQAMSGLWKKGEWERHQRVRPGKRELDAAYESCVELWMSIARRVPEVREMTKAPPGSGVAGKFRTIRGGHLLFRPIGLEILMTAVAELIRTGATPRQAVRRVASVPMQLDRAPWKGLLWNASSKRMITEHKKVCLRVLVYAAGGSAPRGGAEALRQQVAKIIGEDVPPLRRYASVGRPAERRRK